jgi:hypothetical protein
MMFLFVYTGDVSQCHRGTTLQPGPRPIVYFINRAETFAESAGP